MCCQRRYNPIHKLKALFCWKGDSITSLYSKTADKNRINKNFKKNQKKILKFFIAYWYYLNLVSAQGFEPWTYWLKVSCSTSWATRSHTSYLVCILSSLQKVKGTYGWLSIWSTPFEKKYYYFLQLSIIFRFRPFTSSLYKYSLIFFLKFQ